VIYQLYIRGAKIPGVGNDGYSTTNEVIEESHEKIQDAIAPLLLLLFTFAGAVGMAMSVNRSLSAEEAETARDRSLRPLPNQRQPPSLSPLWFHRPAPPTR
jgi:hypothetical protein